MGLQVKRALISVSDKSGVVPFARALADLGAEILSTGGTHRTLIDADVAAVEVSSVTGFPEIMDGRVKTLHPMIHGGILARRDVDGATMATHGIVGIDLVAVNLYPFEHTIAQPGCTLEQAIENIDIGGPAMLRSAAKNHRDVLVVVDPSDYPGVVATLRSGGSKQDERLRMALKAFRHTAAYDAAIARYLGEQQSLESLQPGSARGLPLASSKSPQPGSARGPPLAVRMKVMVVGSGGREHALAWTVSRSPRVEAVLVAPGNPGTAAEGGKVRNVAVDADDFEALAGVAESGAVDLTIVGPEAPLAAGIRDLFDARGLACFAPTQAAAQLESSKSFAKSFMARHGIPTAAHGTFSDSGAAEDYIRAQGAPVVVKADGLAAGKGVVVAQDVEDAVAAARDMLSGASFGDAGRQVVVEEFLVGEEASFTCVVDGRQALPLASSQDHKARDEGDTGRTPAAWGPTRPRRSSPRRSTTA